ncbi:MAG TPA: plastocyanin/azurin family copper-binding protein [Thermoanaerobaculia bacterium]|nr:plastocyanin/azurin family copper-binding protein [Thermoanaerobaculia bacterium]
MRIAVPALVLLLAACSSDEPGDLSQKSTPPQSGTDTATPPQMGEASTMNPVIPPNTDLPQKAPTPAPSTQEVHLIEYSIHMPDTLPAGHIAFNVENGGKETHAFEIEGNGIEEKTDELSRGNTASLEVDLRPGTYTIYCPVDGHKGKGMKKTITVK